MKRQTSAYCVGAHTFHILHPVSVKLTELLPSFLPFVAPTQEGEDILFELRLEDSVPQPIDVLPTDICFDWENARCLIRPLNNSEHIVTITPQGTGITYQMRCANGFRWCTASFPDIPSVDRFVLNNFLMMLYAFNAARHRTLLMHASVVACENKGYLFLGKSGTGKSTHTSLWLRHIPHCHLMNDDNPIVRVRNGQATVYGSPWSGKTPCYRNESLPVGAFVRLDQAPRNEITKEYSAYAFAALLPSASCLKQDKGIYAGVVATVTELVSLTPTFRLKCLPERSAAELCRETIIKE